MSRVGHLARRFVGSLTSRPPSESDVAWVRGHLLDGEFDLWSRMSPTDRRHSVVVARRFVDAAGRVGRDEVAAALLHDVGKVESGLGTFGRVLATIVGPRTRRFRTYHEHERLGIELAAAAGSTSSTLELLRGDGPFATALRRADEI